MEIMAICNVPPSDHEAALQAGCRTFVFKYQDHRCPHRSHEWMYLHARIDEQAAPADADRLERILPRDGTISFQRVTRNGRGQVAFGHVGRFEARGDRVTLFDWCCTNGAKMIEETEFVLDPLCLPHLVLREWPQRSMVCVGVMLESDTCLGPPPTMLPALPAPECLEALEDEDGYILLTHDGTNP